MPCPTIVAVHVLGKVDPDSEYWLYVGSSSGVFRMILVSVSAAVHAAKLAIMKIGTSNRLSIVMH